MQRRRWHSDGGSGVIHYLELPKLSHYNTGTELEKWLYYLKNEGNAEEDETMRILLKENPNLNQAHEKYLSFTMDSELVDAYEAHMKWKRDYASGIDEALKKGIEQGIEKGIEKGEKNSKIKIAKNMLDNGSEIAFVSKCTGMTIDELRRLSDS